MYFPPLLQPLFSCSLLHVQWHETRWHLTLWIALSLPLSVSKSIICLRSRRKMGWWLHFLVLQTSGFPPLSLHWFLSTFCCCFEVWNGHLYVLSTNDELGKTCWWWNCLRLVSWMWNWALYPEYFFQPCANGAPCLLMLIHCLQPEPVSIFAVQFSSVSSAEWTVE